MKREARSAPIRILVVDDHSLFRRGVVEVLRADPGFDVVGEGQDGHEALARARALHPDVVLMDLYMPGGSGLDAAREIKRVLPRTRIVFLTVSEEDRDLFDAVKLGADGYLLKDVDPATLCRTLQGVSRGEAHITPSLAGKILEEFAQRRPGSEARPPAAALSVREQEVLGLLTKGAVNKEIAVALGISLNTVKNHLRHIMEKLHLENRVQVVSYALREGLVPRDPER